MDLLQGPTGWRFLIREVPLYPSRGGAAPLCSWNRVRPRSTEREQGGMAKRGLYWEIELLVCR